MLEFLGWNLSFSDLTIIGGALLGMILGWAKLKASLDKLSIEVDELKNDKKEEAKRITGVVDAVRLTLEARVSSLETEARTQQAHTSAMNATLVAIQNSLTSVSGRLDTIITQMLENKHSGR